MIAHTEGIVTVTPTTRDAEIYVENRLVQETTMLRHGMTIQFGRNHIYKFIDPRFEEVSEMFCPPPPHPALTMKNVCVCVGGYGF